MSRIRFNEGSAPSTPPAGKIEIYASDDTYPLIRSIDDTGLNRALSDIPGYSTTSQAPVAETRTYITGSQIPIPVTKLQIGTILRWGFNMTKTAAGTAASTFDIAFGTAGTTADTARVSFTKPAGTAAADEAWITIVAVVRGPITATGVVVGTFSLIHNLAATGHAIIPCVVVNTVSAAFDLTTPTYVGVCITSGASDAITIEQVTAETLNI